MAEIAETAVAVNNVDALADHYLAKHWEEGEDCGKGDGAVHDEKGYIIHLEPICEIADAGAVLVGVSYDDHFVTPIDEFRRQLVDVAFDSSWLWKEEVAHHGDVVSGRHLD